MPPTDSLLKVSEVSFSRNGSIIFQNISFELQAGEILVILGPSGCGKTTLLRCLNRLESVGKGEIFLQGVPVSNIPVCELRRRIGMVFQTPALLPGTVEGNISLGPDLRGQGLAKDKLSLLMAEVGLDASFKDREVAELSTGERQRVSLAQVLANKPEVFLLDEPTSALDLTAALTVENLIKNLHSSLGTGTIFVTHDLNQAMRFNARALVLGNGGILAEGNIQELVHSNKNSQLQNFFRGQLSPNSAGK